MKRILFGISFVVLLLGLGALKVYGGRPSDTQLIRKALDDAVQDAREGHSGKVMDLLSNQAIFNNETSIPKGEVSNYIKSAKPDVTVLAPTPVVTGDKAVIVSPVQVNLSVAVASVPVGKVNARIEFGAEPGFAYLIFPVKNWKITKITVEGPVPEL